MKHRKFSGITGEISPERRARIDAIKKKAGADAAGQRRSIHSPSTAMSLSAVRRTRSRTRLTASASSVVDGEPEQRHERDEQAERGCAFA